MPSTSDDSQRARVEGEKRPREVELEFALSALSKFHRAFAIVRTREQTETLVAELVSGIFSANWAVLYMKEGSQLTFRAAYGTPEDLTPEPLSVRKFRELPDASEGPIVLREGVDWLKVGGEAAVVAAMVRVGQKDTGLMLLGPRGGGADYTQGDLALLGTLAEDAAASLRTAEMCDGLRDQAFVDPLTSCYNRRGFDEHLHVELVRARRYRRPLSLLLLDLDHFKWINDVLGHQVGDHALQRIAGTLLTAFRTTDRVCRYGGDEFAVIFPETPKSEALRLADRLRAQIEALFPDPSLPRAVTATLGIAAFPQDGETPDTLFQIADRALYQGKWGGGNRVNS